MMELCVSSEVPALFTLLLKANLILIPNRIGKKKGECKLLSDCIIHCRDFIKPLAGDSSFIVHFHSGRFSVNAYLVHFIIIGQFIITSRYDISCVFFNNEVRQLFRFHPKPSAKFFFSCNDSV